MKAQAEEDSDVICANVSRCWENKPQKVGLLYLTFVHKQFSVCGWTKCLGGFVF